MSFFDPKWIMAGLFVSRLRHHSPSKTHWQYKSQLSYIVLIRIVLRKLDLDCLSQFYICNLWLFLLEIVLKIAILVTFGSPRLLLLNRFLDVDIHLTGAGSRYITFCTVAAQELTETHPVWDWDYKYRNRGAESLLQSATNCRLIAET